MLFITNRFLEEGATPLNEQNQPTNLPRSVTFAKDNRVEQSIYFCDRKSAGNYQEIGSQEFFSQLKISKYKEILFYIHGFNTQPEDAFENTEKLQGLLNKKKVNHTKVVPLIWPCGERFGILRDYFDDQKAADASEFAFMRLIEKFFEWREADEQMNVPCTKRINVLAHSMGNRVLQGAIRKVVQYYQPQGMPLIFRNVFLVAADLVNETLEEGKDGQYICESARNVVVYYAADDLALRSSKVANVRNSIASRRLGHTGPQRLEKVAKNVYVVDCDNFNNTYDPPLGHTYFMTKHESPEFGLAFEHIWQCLETGRVNNQRQIILKDS